jgi:thiol-disulfide isomerase/thioredoxin
MMKKYCSLLILFTIFMASESFAKDLNAGPWKFTLKTTHAEVPFIIDFQYQGKKLTGVLKNGEELIPLEDISVVENNLSIPLQAYELSLELSLLDENTLSGKLVRHNKNPEIKTSVLAVHGISERFDLRKKKKSSISLTGKWSLEMVDEKNIKTAGIGSFTQTENRFKGTILSPTGDYRYIEGYVSEKSFEGASFDGVYNYLLRGTIKNGKMEAALLSNSMTKIYGTLDSKAELPDAYKQTQINELKFIFPDLKGQNVTLNHSKFKNKPVIVQIFGSWCPNCIDEMNYLIPWYLQNAKRGVEIIALAFERSLSVEDATRQLIKTQKKLKVPYVILQAGSTSEDKPGEKLNGLTNFISFPTTIFLNKKHEVVKVHAGFNGPSTGEFYEKWKVEFNQTVNGLLK